MPTVGTNQDVPYVQYDGSVNVGGSVSWRDNNPGNIEASSFANAHGAIGTDGRFAIFPDAGTGRQALVSLLRSDSYQALTIEQAMERYAPPDENDTDAYTSFISDTVGVDPSTAMSDLTSDQLDAFASGIQTFEGNTPGKTYQNGDASAPDWVQNLLDGSGSDDPEPTPDSSPSPTPDPEPNPPPGSSSRSSYRSGSNAIARSKSGSSSGPSGSCTSRSDARPHSCPTPDPSSGDGPEDPGGEGDGGGGGDDGGEGGDVEGGGGGGGGEGGGGGGDGD